MRLPRNLVRNLFADETFISHQFKRYDERTWWAYWYYSHMPCYRLWILNKDSQLRMNPAFKFRRATKNAIIPAAKTTIQNTRQARVVLVSVPDWNNTRLNLHFYDLDGDDVDGIEMIFGILARAGIISNAYQHVPAVEYPLWHAFNYELTNTTTRQPPIKQEALLEGMCLCLTGLCTGTLKWQQFWGGREGLSTWRGCGRWRIYCRSVGLVAASSPITVDVERVSLVMKPRIEWGYCVGMCCKCYEE